jgi:hypothetical protein
MRNHRLIISALILTQIACTKDIINKNLSMLYGKWSPYQSINLTITNDTIKGDTIFVLNQFLQFDKTDFCKRIYVRNDSSIIYNFKWVFIEPDTISIISCPEEQWELGECEPYWWYNNWWIEEINEYSMILKLQWDTVDIETHEKIGNKFSIDYFNRVPE